MHQTRALCNPFGHVHVVDNANKAYLWKNLTNQQGRLWFNKKIRTQLGILQFLYNPFIWFYSEVFTNTIIPRFYVIRFRHNFECRHIYSGSVQYLQGPVTDGKWLSAFPPRLRPMTPLNVRRAWMTWDFSAWKWCLTETCTNWDTWNTETESHGMFTVSTCARFCSWTAKLGRFKCLLSTFFLAWLTWPRFLWPLSWGLRLSTKAHVRDSIQNRYIYICHLYIYIW